MKRNIEVSEDTFSRLESLAQGFDTPESVIMRLLDAYDDPSKTSSTTPPSNQQTQNITPRVVEYGKLEINLYPSDPKQFKAFLLNQKQAWVLLHYGDDTKKLHNWNAARFTQHSDVMANLRSGYLRGWREKGIIRADIAIDRSELPLD